MPFSKGDKNINRNGRPRSFDRFRSLAQQIAHEVAKAKNGEPIYVDGRKITVAEAILRQWAVSKEPRLQMKFIEVAFGNAPNKIELSGAPVFMTVPAKNYDADEWQKHFAGHLSKQKDETDDDDEHDME
jgi:hypothetical protein